MKNKKGISLIVLVITIIVMIILAASVVVSLNNNGIIDKANNAVDATDISQVQNLAALAWSDVYLEYIENPSIDIETEVKVALEEAGVDLDDYDVDASKTGVTVTKKGGNITFTIDGESYEAESNMTWKEWVESDYNVDGYQYLETINSAGGMGFHGIDYDNGFIVTADSLSGDGEMIGYSYEETFQSGVTVTNTRNVNPNNYIEAREYILGFYED